MEDLQAAVLACLDPTADPTLKQRALTYCQDIRNSPDGWAFVLQSLSLSMKPEVAFWCLTVVHDVISNPTRYPVSLSAEQRAALRSTLIAYLANVVYPERVVKAGTTAETIQLPNFLLNKVAQPVVALIAVDYPHAWPLAFSDCVLPLVGRRRQLSNQPNSVSNGYLNQANGGPSQANAMPNNTDSPFSTTEVTYGSVGMFLRLLRAIDDDATSVRIAQVSDAHRITSVRVKDAMRDDCVTDIIQICADLIREPKFASQALDIIGRYIEWIDVGLVVQEHILKHIYEAITTHNECPFRSAAAACLRAIVQKRMSVGAKANLLRMLDIDALLGAIRADVIIANDEDNVDAEVNLQSGLVEVASLINVIAIIALDCVKAVCKVGNSSDAGNSTSKGNQNQAAPTVADVDPELLAYVGNVARHALPLSLQLLDDNTEEEAGPTQTLECVTAYVNVYGQLVRNGAIPSTHENVAVIGVVLNAIEERGRFPNDLDPSDENSERGRAFAELRKALVKRVFGSIGRWFTQLCVEFVKQLYGKAREPGTDGTNSDVSRMELALSLVISLISVSGDDAKVQEICAFVLGYPPECMQLSSAAGLYQQAINGMDRNNSTLSTTVHARQQLVLLVSNNYFEVVARSAKILVSDSEGQVVSTVLKVIFDERGLGHLHSEGVRSKAASALVKISKPLRGMMSHGHVEAIVRAAHDHIFPVEEDVSSQRWKNQMQMFETVGYLLGTTQNRDTVQVVQLVYVILKSIVDGVMSRQFMSCVAYIGAAGYLSKGFGGDSKYIKAVGNGKENHNSGSKTNDIMTAAQGSNPSSSVVPPGGTGGAINGGGVGTGTRVVLVRNEKKVAMSNDLKKVWVECIEGVLKGSEACLNHGEDPWMVEMRLKVVFFLHRMVDTVGTDVIWYLQQVVPRLLRFGSSPSELREVMSLMCQSTIKFRLQFASVTDKVEAEIVERVQLLSFSIDEQSGMAVSEADREMVEVMRVFMYWVNVMVSCELMDRWWDDHRQPHTTGAPPSASSIPTVSDGSKTNHDAGRHQGDDCRQGMLSVVMQWVMRNAVGAHMDVRVASSVMRMAWQTIGCMIERWGGDTQRFGGMQDFVMHQVATGCVKTIVMASLFRTRDYSNGEVLNVVTEIVRVQSRCVRRYGAQFADAVFAHIGHAVSQLDWTVYLTDLTKKPLTSTFQDSVQRWIVMARHAEQASVSGAASVASAAAPHGIAGGVAGAALTTPSGTTGSFT